MMSVWAIIVVALIGATPVTELVASYETKESCEFAAVEFVTEIKSKLREDVLAFGAGCVRVNIAEGKKI